MLPGIQAAEFALLLINKSKCSWYRDYCFTSKGRAHHLLQGERRSILRVIPMSAWSDPSNPEARGSMAQDALARKCLLPNFIHLAHQANLPEVSKHAS